VHVACPPSGVVSPLWLCGSNFLNFTAQVCGNLHYLSLSSLDSFQDLNPAPPVFIVYSIFPTAKDAKILPQLPLA